MERCIYDVRFCRESLTYVKQEFATHITQVIDEHAWSTLEYSPSSTNANN